MNDHYTTERLMLRIYHELFGKIEYKKLTYTDKLMLAGHIRTMLKPTASEAMVLQYVTYKWTHEWKLFCNEILANSAYNMGRFCACECVVVAGLPGTGVEFLQRYIHNVANQGAARATSARPINGINTPERLQLIQRELAKPNFDFERTFNMIEEYKQEHKLRVPVLSITEWNKHTLNWLGYFKDVSVLKWVPVSKEGRRLSALLNHKILETQAPRDARHIHRVHTVQGSYKNSMLNTWSKDNNYYPTKWLSNTADNGNNHWLSTDTFHPTTTLDVGWLHNEQMLRFGFEQFLQEVPDLEKSARQEAGKNLAENFRSVLNDEFNGLNL